MRILICTGIYPPQVGGPAYYALGLREALKEQGHTVSVLTYELERKLPTIIRHIWFFFRAFLKMAEVDYVIALDTFSVGLPAVCAAKLRDKKIVIRTGGDFLWETFLERTRREILLKDFYNLNRKELSTKESLIFSLTRYVLHEASAVVFSTAWQRDIFMKPYGLSAEKVFVIENEYMLPKGEFKPVSKTYLWAGRPIVLKNVERLKRAFDKAKEYDFSLKLSVISDVSRNVVAEKMKECYAVVLPSLSDISPNFILEAISLGKPCIVTCETGIADRLGDVAMFINPLDEHDIEEKIIALSKDQTYNEYVDKVRHFSFKHSMSDIAREFIEIYSRLVSQP